NPAFLLGSSSATRRAHKSAVRIGRTHDDASDSPSLLQPQMCPCFTRVSRTVNSVTHDISISDDPGFAGSNPDHAVIRRCNGNGTNCANWLFVENRLPVVSSVCGLPNSSTGGAGIVGSGVSSNAGN